MPVKTRGYQNHLALYVWASQFAFNEEVTDIGCGEGFGLQAVSIFAKSVRGLDISPTFLNRAKKKQYYCPTSFEVVDIDHDPNLHGFVLAFEVVEHVKEPRKLVEIMAVYPFIASLPHNDHHPLHLTTYHSIEEVAKLFEGIAVDIFKYAHGVVYTADSGVVPERYVIVSQGLLARVPGCTAVASR